MHSLSTSGLPPALSPIIVSPLAEAIPVPAPLPRTVFETPVIPLPANSPTAVLSSPAAETLNNNAAAPTAVLLSAVLRSSVAAPQPVTPVAVVWVKSDAQPKAELNVLDV